MTIGRVAVFAVAVVLAVSSFLPSAQAQSGETGPPETVKQIFKKHCVECHGKEGERTPKLKQAEAGFDFIYDVPKMLAAQTKKGARYIVPGAPDDSILFNLIKSDEMPDEANFFVRPALEDAEKAVIRAWITGLGP